MILDVTEVEVLPTVPAYEGEDPSAEPTRATSVWHYTTSAGLVGIITNHEFWASSPVTMNDLSEARHGLRVIESAWNLVRDGPYDPDLLTFGDSVFADGLLSESRTFYVLSASKIGDSLNQWQGYTTGQGFSIQLATHVPLALRAPRGFETDSGFEPGNWYDVIYDEDEQLELATRLVRFCLHHDFSYTEGRGWAVKIRLLTRVGALALRLKHPSFADEREVRFIQSGYPDLPPFFRTDGRVVIPFVKVTGGTKFHREGDDVKQLPIVAVMLGPSSVELRRVNRSTVGLMLAHRGYLPEVQESAIPYRP